MKTFSAKDSEVQRDWYVIDATDKVLGRVASEVAHRLRGKHQTRIYTSCRYRRFHHRCQRQQAARYRKQND